MNALILHHYPQSPVAEKVRIALGIKGLAWRSVEIPRLPPKPKLMPLTGGYRRTPVLQVGADVYCDSQCILRALEALHPEPTFYPGGAAGLPWALSRWSDDVVFPVAIGVVLGAAAKDIPADFAADRGRLYFGKGFNLDAKARDLPHLLAQLRAHLGWLDERLASGRRFVLGHEPGLPDALAWYLVWFVRGRYAGGPDLLAEFGHVEAWEGRVAAIGHGESTEMNADEALAAAKAATPAAAVGIDERDGRGFAAGDSVAVVPDGDGGDPPVTGTLTGLNRDEIVITREAPETGTVAVHFPVVGYRLAAA